MTNQPENKLCTLLPPAGAKLLRDASQTPLDETATDPGLNRRKAMDRALRAVKLLYPKYFKPGG